MISHKKAQTLRLWIPVLLSAMLIGLSTAAYSAEIAGYKRESLVDYVKKRHENLMDYSASGIVDCTAAGVKAGAAQLVMHKGKRVKNVGVTVNHIIFTSSCEPIDTTKCSFVPLFEPEKKIPIAVKPENVGKCVSANDDREEDFVVFTLKYPLVDNPKKGIHYNPVLVPNEPVTVADHIQLTQVSAFADNYPGTSGHVVDCESRDTNKFPGFPLLTTCSGGHGGSGSYQMQKKRNTAGRIEHWLYAIESTGPVGAEENSPYSTDPRHSNYMTATPFRGKFFERTNAVLKEAEAEAGLAGVPVAFEKTISSPSIPMSVSGDPCQGLTGEQTLKVKNHFVFRGTELRSLTADVCRSRGRNKGVLVSSVTLGTPAFDAGFEPGDLIFELDDQVPNSLDDFEKIVSAHEDRRFIRVEVIGKAGQAKHLLLFKPR